MRTLSQQLRRVYLLVHPDLFSCNPVVSTSNSKALATLNTLVSTLKARSRFSSTELELEFVTTTRLEPRVCIHLPSTDPNAPRTRRAIQLGLQSLFKQCGLEPGFTWGDFFTEKEAPPPPMEGAGMVDNVMRFAAECRDMSIALREANLPKHGANLLRLSELRGKHRLRMTILQEEFTAMDTLHEIVTRVYHFISGLAPHSLKEMQDSQVVLVLNAKTSGMDSSGRIQLCMTDSNEYWYTTILECVPRIEEYRRVTSRVASLQEQLGTDVLPQPVVALEYGQQYETLLQAMRDNPIPLQGLSLVIVAPTQSLSVDLNMGVVLLPVDTDIQALEDFLRYNTLGASDLYSSYLKQRKEYEDTITLLKKRLRLSSLEYDPDKVTKDQMMQCCATLEEMTGSRGISTIAMHGLAVLVSDSYEFTPVGVSGVVHIPWDLR